MSLKKCFFSVVYPAGRPYVSEFLSSLEKQTVKDFDIIIGVDAWPEFEGIIPKSLKDRITLIPCTGSPCAIRANCLDYIRQRGYELIVMGDCDDVFSSNRVNIAGGLLEDYDIVVNDFEIINQEGKTMKSCYLSSRLKDGQEITLEMMLDYNLIGLSIASVRAKSLDGIMLAADVIAVDWYLFSQMLLKGARAVFTAQAKTFYRMHGNNFFALSQFDAAGVTKTLQAKVRHYKALAGQSPVFDERYRTYAWLIESLSVDQGKLKQYVDFVNRQNVYNPLWFEKCKYKEMV